MNRSDAARHRIQEVLEEIAPSERWSKDAQALLDALVAAMHDSKKADDWSSGPSLRKALGVNLEGFDYQKELLIPRHAEESVHGDRYRATLPGLLRSKEKDCVDAIIRAVLKVLKAHWEKDADLTSYSLDEVIEAGELKDIDRRFIGRVIAIARLCGGDDGGSLDGERDGRLRMTFRRPDDFESLKDCRVVGEFLNATAHGNGLRPWPSAPMRRDGAVMDPRSPVHLRRNSERELMRPAADVARQSRREEEQTLASIVDGDPTARQYDALTPLGASEHLTSSFATVPPGAKAAIIDGFSGGGGGGGGGAGRLGQSGLPGEASQRQRRQYALTPGHTYLVLIGAGGMGGSGAMRTQDHGQGGTNGGYTAITDGVDFVAVLDGTSQAASTQAAPAVAVPPNVQTVGGDQLRFAIVDVDSGEVDNVVVAPEHFFDDRRAIAAALEKRIVIGPYGPTLVSRATRAVAIRIHDGESVAPGWRIRSLADLHDPRTRKFEPATVLPDLAGAAAGRGGISAEPEPLSSLNRSSLRVLSLASEWSSGHGGLSTISRELCCALASLGHEVICLLPRTPSSVEQQAAADAGVRIVVAPAVGTRSEMNESLLRKPSLPVAFVPDVVIGHGHVTGPHAKVQVAEHFPQAHLVHVAHTKVAEAERYKSSSSDSVRRAEQNEVVERDLAESASMVLAVGPRLRREVERLVHASSSRPKVVELIPGLAGDDDERAHPPIRSCMFIGRTEDEELKGLDIVGECVRQVRITHPDVEIALRGAPAPHDVVSLRESLGRKLGNPNAVRVDRFDADPLVIRRDILGATVVLMPSRSEGFGLAAWEAIGLGVPVLVSNQSGLGDLLVREYRQFADEIVVPILHDRDETYDAWARRLKAVFDDVPGAFRRASELRAILRQRFTWRNATANVVNSLRASRLAS